MSSETIQTQEPIQVATVEMPPPPAEPIPPESPPPPLPPKNRPAPISRPAQNDPLVRKSKPTPLPSSKPMPSLAATPTPSPTLSPAPALASPSPTPQQTPTQPGEPSPDPSPTQLANLTEAETQKKIAMQKFFEAQDLEVPQELPPGFKSWEEFEKFMTDGEGFEKKANDLMKLPENTSGSENAGSGPPTDSDSDSGENGGSPRLGFNPGGWFSRSNSNNIDPQDNFESEEERRLRTRNLRHIDTSLNLEPLPTIPYPKDVQTNNIGYHSVKFTHDQLQFFVRWESALEPQLRKAEVQFYPPAKPKQTMSLSLKWQKEWDEDIKKLVIAVQLAYERQKKGQP